MSTPLRALCLCAAVATVSRTAHAQTAAPAATPAPAQTAADEAQRDQARVHFQRGVELANAGRWLDAITELTAARDLRPTAPVMYNLGLAQRAVGRNREAIESFQECLRLLAPGRSADLATQVQDFIRELSAAFGRLEVRVEPTHATVYIDGAVADLSHGPLQLDPGRHVVLADARGFASETRSVEVPRGGSAVVVLRMVPDGVAAHLRIEANVGSARIRIDDHDVGFGVADENVRPGPHTIEVRADGYSSFRRDFDAVPGTRTTVHAVLTNQRSIFVSPWFWAGTVAVAAALVVGGVVFFSRVDDPYVGSWGVVSDALTAHGGH